MNVQELIEALENFDKFVPVIIATDYTQTGEYEGFVVEKSDDYVVISVGEK